MKPYTRIGVVVKNNKGVSCTCNQYIVSGFAMVNGEPKKFEYEVQHRDARAAKQAVAEQYGCSASQVLVNFQLKKRKFTVNCSYDDFMNALRAYDIAITEKTETESEK